MYGDNNKFNIRSRFDANNRPVNPENIDVQGEAELNDDEIMDDTPAEIISDDTTTSEEMLETETDNSIRDMEQSILDIDDSDCMWNYMNKVSIQGRLYFNQFVKVSDTSLGTQVAAFNLLIKKDSKNGVKRHRIYVKTYNKAVVAWLKEQKVGTWVRVDGRLESVSGKNYVNATNVQSFSDNHMKAIFDDNPQKLVDWEQSSEREEGLKPGKNNIEVQSKLKQIKNQTRTILNHNNNVSIEDGVEGQEDNAIVTVDFELSQSDLAELGLMTKAVLISNDEDENMLFDDDTEATYEESETNDEDDGNNNYIENEEDDIATTEQPPSFKDSNEDLGKIDFHEAGYVKPPYHKDISDPSAPMKIDMSQVEGYPFTPEVTSDPDELPPDTVMATQEETDNAFGKLNARQQQTKTPVKLQGPIRGRLIKKTKDTTDSNSRFKSRFD